MSERVKCERCGGSYGLGDFPFCRGSQSDHGEWVTAEQPTEPWHDEMLDTDGVDFTSNREWVRYMDKNNIIPRKNPNNLGAGRPIYFDMKGK